MINVLTILGFILAIIALIVTVFFGVIGLGALWAVGALIARDAQKAAAEFNGLLNWYVVANDGTRRYDATEPNCLSRIYSCHWALLTSASEYMSQEMRADILAATQKMILGESISEEFSRLARPEPAKSPLLVWVVKLSVSESLKNVIPESWVGRVVRKSLRLIAPHSGHRSTSRITCGDAA